jgi:hypothetical protein
MASTSRRRGLLCIDRFGKTHEQEKKSPVEFPPPGFYALLLTNSC